MESRAAENKQGVVLLTALRLPGKLQAASTAAPHPGPPVCFAAYTEGANELTLRIISLALCNFYRQLCLAYVHMSGGGSTTT